MLSRFLLLFCTFAWSTGPLAARTTKTYTVEADASVFVGSPDRRAGAEGMLLLGRDDQRKPVYLLLDFATAFADVRDIVSSGGVIFDASIRLPFDRVGNRSVDVYATYGIVTERWNEATVRGGSIPDHYYPSQKSKSNDDSAGTAVIDDRLDDRLDDIGSGSIRSAYGFIISLDSYERADARWVVSSRENSASRAPKLRIEYSLETPDIDRFVPAKPQPGAEVTIEGEAFVFITNVRLDSRELTFRRISQYKLVATLPADAKAGTLWVLNEAGDRNGKYMDIPAGAVPVNPPPPTPTPAPSPTPPAPPVVPPQPPSADEPRAIRLKVDGRTDVSDPAVWRTVEVERAGSSQLFVILETRGVLVSEPWRTVRTLPVVPASGTSVVEDYLANDLGFLSGNLILRARSESGRTLSNEVRIVARQRAVRVPTSFQAANTCTAECIAMVAARYRVPLRPWEIMLSLGRDLEDGLLLADQGIVSSGRDSDRIAVTQSRLGEIVAKAFEKAGTANVKLRTVFQTSGTGGVFAGNNGKANWEAWRALLLQETNGRPVTVSFGSAGSDDKALGHSIVVNGADTYGVVITGPAPYFGQLVRTGRTNNAKEEDISVSRRFSWDSFRNALASSQYLALLVMDTTRPAFDDTLLIQLAGYRTPKSGEERPAYVAYPTQRAWDTALTNPVGPYASLQFRPSGSGYFVATVDGTTSLPRVDSGGSEFRAVVTNAGTLDAKVKVKVVLEANGRSQTVAERDFVAPPTQVPSLLRIPTKTPTPYQSTAPGPASLRYELWNEDRLVDSVSFSITIHPSLVGPTSNHVAANRRGQATLTVDSPEPTVSFQWFKAGVAVPAGTGKSLVVQANPPATYTVRVLTKDGIQAWSGEIRPVAGTYNQLTNLSYRTYGAEAKVGFVVPAVENEIALLARTTSLSLANFGVARPTLVSGTSVTLLDRTGAVVSRADGFDATTARAAQQVSRAGIWPAPSANREGAVLANIKAGQFTVVGRPLQVSEQGDLLTEACVLDGAIDNFSVLAVLRGSQADIVGVGVAGRGGKFLVRAVGPSLGQFGIPTSAFCRDPILEIYDSQGRLVSRPNAGASGTAVNSAKEAGAFSLVSGSADVATVVELPLGGTTLHIRSSSGQGGLVLVELYALD